MSWLAWLTRLSRLTCGCLDDLLALLGCYHFLLLLLLLRRHGDLLLRDMLLLRGDVLLRALLRCCDRRLLDSRLNRLHLSRLLRLLRLLTLNDLLTLLCLSHDLGLLDLGLLNLGGWLLRLELLGRHHGAIRGLWLPGQVEHRHPWSELDPGRFLLHRRRLHLLHLWLLRLLGGHHLLTLSGDLLSLLRGCCGDGLLGSLLSGDDALGLRLLRARGRRLRARHSLRHHHLLIQRHLRLHLRGGGRCGSLTWLHWFRLYHSCFLFG